MIRTLFVEFILPLLAFLVLSKLLRSIFAALRSTSTPRAAPRRPPAQTVGELKKDPVCGTYVSTAASVTSKINGQVVHFCSEECRSKYRVA